MIIPLSKPVHLAYSMNVHRGESFHDQWSAIRECASRVRSLLNLSGKPFGIGLRLGAKATAELKSGSLLQEFSSWCASNGYYVFTINGFPYGHFHEAPVKAEVYRPDWTKSARLDYTIQLADILAALLPEGIPGSISTMPGWYAPDYGGKASRKRASDAVTRNLAAVAMHLEAIAKNTGRDICLGLEPEPGCNLEKCDDITSFFMEEFIPRAAPIVKAALPDSGDAEALLRRRIGVCLDVCHCAVVYEDPATVLREIAASGIRIAKIQLSAALAADLRTESVRKSTLKALAKFIEPVYFHQTSARYGSRVQQWADLQVGIDGIEAEPGADDVRVHFHVPLHWAGQGPLESTRRLMTDAFWKLVQNGMCQNLEIETYTFHVMPRRMAGKDLAVSIEKEYRWVLTEGLAS